MRGFHDHEAAVIEKDRHLRTDRRDQCSQAAAEHTAQRTWPEARRSVAGPGEERYRSELEGAIVAYIGFADEHSELAAEIAGEASRRAAAVGSGRVGRTKRSASSSVLTSPCLHPARAHELRGRSGRPRGLG